MLYDPKLIPAITVTGRNVAHAKRSSAERAFLAADLHLDRAILAKPTIGQAAILLKVGRPYVAAAIAIADNADTRAAVLAGDRPLIVPGAYKNLESLAAHFARSTPAERLDAARTIGVDVLWDSLIGPLV
jgi:hypothetical protein